MVSYGGIWGHTGQKKKQKQNQKQKKNFTVGRGAGEPIAGQPADGERDRPTGAKDPLTVWAFCFALILRKRRISERKIKTEGTGGK